MSYKECVLYNLDELKKEKELWSGSKSVPALCSWCNEEFEVKYGTLYNIIKRDADGIFCTRKCAGAARAFYTQEKYQEEGGKSCRRCGEFKVLDEFSSLPNPPYLRAECKRCHNYKPARKFSNYKDKALKAGAKFNLSLDEFIVFWNRNCYYCDDKVVSTRIELKDNKLGYAVTNIVSCCRTCQQFKGELEHSSFIKLCNKISNNAEMENLDE